MGPWEFQGADKKLDGNGLGLGERGWGSYFTTGPPRTKVRCGTVLLYSKTRQTILKHIIYIHIYFFFVAWGCSRACEIWRTKPHQSSLIDGQLLKLASKRSKSTGGVEYELAVCQTVLFVSLVIVVCLFGFLVLLVCILAVTVFWVLSNLLLFTLLLSMTAYFL